MPRPPTFAEFLEMVARGRLWRWDDPATPYSPTKEEMDACGSCLELGRLHGYSEDDIAHFYKHGMEYAAYEQYLDDWIAAK